MATSRICDGNQDDALKELLLSERRQTCIEYIVYLLYRVNIVTLLDHIYKADCCPRFDVLFS